MYCKPIGSGHGKVKKLMKTKRIWAKQVVDDDLAVFKGEKEPNPIEGTALLSEEVAAYLPSGKIKLLLDTLEFAKDAHSGQKRLTGDDYITHPIAVTRILANLKMDLATLQAALLHDVVEDCDVTLSTIEKHFGTEVAQLVDSATKVSEIQSRISIPKSEPINAEWETVRKLLTATAEDIRVIIMKLADRLHNMETLAVLPEDRRIAMARETRDIYAPLAERLGTWRLRWRLEDLSFRWLEPTLYDDIAKIVAARREEREISLVELTNAVADALELAEIKSKVSGRVKNLFSIYEKRVRYESDGRKFDEINDLLAVRVVVENISDCYAVLGVIHSNWQPVPGTFDDYIATPRRSGYRSLHTSVAEAETGPFEVQIRTKEMDESAEFGVAAHAGYKGLQDPKHDADWSWIRKLLSFQPDDIDDDYVEALKTDFLSDQVYVSTPKGEVLELPAGATPLDFAYRIHTDLGHTCSGARVNGHIVTLSTQLQNGDTVEIIRNRQRNGPSRDWIDSTKGFLSTSHAKQKVRQWFRQQSRTENTNYGEDLYARAMRRLGLEEGDISDGFHQNLGYVSLEDMFAALGAGTLSQDRLNNRLANLIDAKLETVRSSAVPIQDHRDRVSDAGIRVLGATGIAVNIAKCCAPIPGDVIVGYITHSRGVTVHRTGCSNLAKRADSTRLVECDWVISDEVYAAQATIEAWDRTALINDLTTVLAVADLNLIEINSGVHQDRKVLISLTIETKGGEEFSNVLSKLEQVRGVIGVRRKN